MSDPLFEMLDQLVPMDAPPWRLGRRPSSGRDSGLGGRRRANQTKPGSVDAPTARCGRVLVVAVAVVAATPAFGLRGLILGFVEGRTSVSFYKTLPAPPAIKKRFLDLSIGAPAGMNPQVLPGQARQITFVTPLDHKRIVWVAPTRGRGFCSVGGMSGGCISKDSERHAGAVTLDGGMTSRNGRITVVR